jgi:hypothetical protein
MIKGDVHLGKMVEELKNKFNLEIPYYYSNRDNII